MEKNEGDRLTNFRSKDAVPMNQPKNALHEMAECEYDNGGPMQSYSMEDYERQRCFEQRFGSGGSTLSRDEGQDC